MTSAYQCFPGAPATMPALKAEKQLAFLCKGPLRGEIMLFPKVRVHCCWVAAKSGLPIRSGGDNNAHVCHFLTSVEIAGLRFTAGKKKKKKSRKRFGKSRASPLKTPPSRLLHFDVKCLLTPCAPLPMPSPPLDSGPSCLSPQDGTSQQPGAVGLVPTSSIQILLVDLQGIV